MLGTTESSRDLFNLQKLKLNCGGVPSNDWIIYLRGKEDVKPLTVVLRNQSRGSQLHASVK